MKFFSVKKEYSYFKTLGIIALDLFSDKQCHSAVSEPNAPSMTEPDNCCNGLMSLRHIN